jgi:ESX secretion system protein EccD
MNQLLPSGNRDAHLFFSLMRASRKETPIQVADEHKVDQSFRLTVVGSARRVDVTLPAGVPVADLLWDLVDMLDEHVDGAAARWGLVQVGGHVLDPERSLAEQGIHDGTMLFLRDITTPPSLPAIDDYAERVALAVDAQRGRWTTRLVTPLLAGGAGACLAVAGLLVIVAADPTSRAIVGVAGAAVSVGAGLAFAIGVRRHNLAAIVVLGGLPLWAAAGAGLAGLGGASSIGTFSAGLGAVAVGSVVAIAVVGAAAVTPAAGIIAATVLPALVLAGCAVSGAGLFVASALLSPLELGALALLPAVTVRVAGIDSANQGVLLARLTRGRHLMAALIIGTVTVLVVSMAVTAVAGEWFARALVTVAAIALAIRARHFRFAAEVAPLLAGALAGVLFLEIPLAVWLGSTLHSTGAGPAILIADGAVMVAAARWKRGWDMPPRAFRWLGRLEALAIAASVPLALGAIGTYDAAGQFTRTLT